MSEVEPGAPWSPAIVDIRGKLHGTIYCSTSVDTGPCLQSLLLVRSDSTPASTVTP